MTTPFSLGTFQSPSSANIFVGALVDGREDIVIDVCAIADPGALPSTLDEMLHDWQHCVAEIGRIVTARQHDAAGAAIHQLAALRALPPICPGQIIQAGANYRSHVIEMSIRTSRAKGSAETDAQLREAASRSVDEQRRGGEPFLFLGSPAALCGACDDIVLPEAGNDHDWEVELAVVIGASARRISAADALGCIAGYTIANDLTTRDRIFRTDLPALGTDWLRSKNWPTALPLGPVVRPTQFFADIDELELQLRLNGEVMQQAHPSDLIFGVAELVSHASSLTLLRPGDVILTGSPAGNGSWYGRFLGPGDVVEASITGLGTQRNRCVAISDGASETASVPLRVTGDLL
jgi:2,4-didehydro-3-deoxy-L-rhamnonate hydrolase